MQMMQAYAQPAAVAAPPRKKLKLKVKSKAGADATGAAQPAAAPEYAAEAAHFSPQQVRLDIGICTGSFSLLKYVCCLAHRYFLHPGCSLVLPSDAALRCVYIGCVVYSAYMRPSWALAVCSQRLRWHGDGGPFRTNTQTHAWGWASWPARAHVQAPAQAAAASEALPTFASPASAADPSTAVPASYTMRSPQAAQRLHEEGVTQLKGVFKAALDWAKTLNYDSDTKGLQCVPSFLWFATHSVFFFFCCQCLDQSQLSVHSRMPICARRYVGSLCLRFA